MRAIQAGCFLALTIVALSACPNSFAQSIIQGTAAVELKLVATAGSGSAAPDFGANYGDPRFLFLGQQSGLVRILDFNQSNPLLGTNFLDVGSVLGTSFTNFAGGERGLLGGAFHPNFSSSDTNAPGYHKFYTYTSEAIVTQIGGNPVPYLTHSELGASGDHQSVIREWTANAPNAQGVITINTSVASRVLMRINQPQSNHNGGGLAFGPDNYLYISLGDGGGGNDNNGGVNSTTDGHTNQNNPDGEPQINPNDTIGFRGHGNGQDRRNVYGKILRIKPTTENDAVGAPTTTLSGDYRIPNDNPFTPQSNPAGSQIPGYQASWVDEIYAMGLRNPFRIGFDRNTGKLYAGDVGQDTREEVDLIVKGGNYGWVAREGRIQNPSYPLSSNPTYVAATGTSFIDPLADYHNDPVGNGGIAVIGGYVYRGTINPALAGKYVFGDLSHSGSGRMLYMDINEPGPNQVYDLTITGSRAKPAAALHGIAEGANGELYYLFDNGQIIQLFRPGDYNFDGQVNTGDYAAWRTSFGTTGSNLAADGNGNGVVDAADYVLWRKYSGLAAGTGASEGGAVPEPSTAALLTVSIAALLCIPRNPNRRRLT